MSLADEKRASQRPRAGDPRLSPEGREVLLRITTGDLAGEFGRLLEETSDGDPMLSGTDGHDD